MILFRQTLLREFAKTGFATLLVLLAVTITTQFIRFLGYAARGTISTDAVLTFLGFAGLRYLPVLLSLTVFISVLFVLTRWYRDSEMTVWFASGLSLRAWIRPTLSYAAPFVLVIALLSLFLTPWASGKAEQYKRQLESRDEISAISPGVFKESRQGDRIFFVEKLTMDLSIVANIFIYSDEGQEEGITVAERGYQEILETGERFLVLEKGRRYVGQPGFAGYKIIEFDKYGVRLENKRLEKYQPTIKATDSFDLVKQQSSAAKAEFIWRLGFPISTLLLCLMAIPLSFVNPRTGRSYNFLVAALVYMIYSNLLSVVQAWVANDTLSPSIGFLLVHFLMVIVTFIFYVSRSHKINAFSFRKIKTKLYENS